MTRYDLYSITRLYDETIHEHRVRYRIEQIGDPKFKIHLLFGRTLFEPLNRAAFLHVVLMEMKHIKKAIDQKNHVTLFHL